MSNKDIRVANTDDLLLLIRLADAYQFNRRPDIEWAEEHLDPDGTHVLSLLLFHHQRPAPARPAPASKGGLLLGLARGGLLGKGGDPMHHRVVVLAKTIDGDMPEEFFLDVPAEAWSLLTTADDFKEEVKEA